jgi:RND family efflux transporter MFP subunit
MWQFLSKSISLIRKRWKLSLLLLLVVGASFWWWTSANAQEELAGSFVPVKRQDFVATLTVSGRLDAKEKARLRFMAGGKLVYLGAKEGDFVSKWQTIATIDRAALQKQLQQNLNVYMKERYDFEDVRDEIKDKVLDTQDNRQVARDQYDLDNQVLNVEIQSIAIQNTVLSAPFAGVLTVSPSNVTGVQLLGSDYFEIVNPETLVFRAAIDEIDLHKLVLGQQAQIFLDAYDEEKIDSMLSYIAFTSSESSSGTVFLLEFPIAATDMSRYRLGMNGDVDIELARRSDTLVIPLDAISEREGQVFVQVRAGDGQTLEERAITLGLENEDEVEVLSGLSESDEVYLPE